MPVNSRTQKLSRGVQICEAGTRLCLPGISRQETYSFKRALPRLILLRQQTKGNREKNQSSVDSIVKGNRAYAI
jgi:hypothetical protein